MPLASIPPTAKRGKRRARKVGLVYVNDFDKGFGRRRCGKGFVYVSSSGKVLRSERTRARIESLVIPPAWEDVWICPRASGHIQARGRDDAGRIQYIYHERWQAISTATKYDRMQLMAKLLPRIRRRVSRDLNGRKLTRQRVLAVVVRLLDKAHLRVGGDRYAEQNGSRGATTLTSDHVDVDRFTVSLDFPGKSGQRHEIEFTDPKTAKVVRQCAEINAQFLFCYHDTDGHVQRIDSTDVNEYLREVSGESISSKDFRTWWGSVLALSELADMNPDASTTSRRKAVANSIATAADALGNTKAVCRKSYIHPGILAAAESGELPSLISKAQEETNGTGGLTAPEALFAKLLPRLDFN